MGAGVVTVFVKNDTPTRPTAAAPDLTSSVPATVAPTVGPTTSVDAAKQLAARNGEKAAPKGAQIPLLPASGVGGHPFGYVLVALGAAIALWIRRTAHT